MYVCKFEKWLLLDMIVAHYCSQGYPVDELTQPTIAMDTFRHIYMSVKSSYIIY